MKRIRPKPEYAVPVMVEELLNRFQYPDEIGRGAEFTPGAGGAMAHILIVSESEPQEIQDKADFTCPAVSSSARLQDIFDSIENQTGNVGSWSVWMAGIFDLDEDVTAPPRCWIRGLGYTLTGGSA